MVPIRQLKKINKKIEKQRTGRPQKIKNIQSVLYQISHLFALETTCQEDEANQRKGDHAGKENITQTTSINHGSNQIKNM